MKAIEIVKKNMNRNEMTISDYKENYILVQLFNYNTEELINCETELDKIAVNKKSGDRYIVYTFKDGKLEINFEE